MLGAFIYLPDKSHCQLVQMVELVECRKISTLSKEMDILLPAATK